MEQLTNLFETRDVQELARRDLSTVARELGIDLERGLDGKQAQKFRETYGEKRLPSRTPPSFYRFLMDAGKDKTLIFLSIAVVVSLAIGLYDDFGPQHDPTEPKGEVAVLTQFSVRALADGFPPSQYIVGWVDGTAILTAVMIAILVNATNDYQKDRQFQKLNESSGEKNVRVLRSGDPTEVSIFDLVVGDVILLGPGDILPCGFMTTIEHEDAIVMSTSDSKGLKIDESSSTGESGSVQKNFVVNGNSDGRDPFLIKNQDGNAHGLVLAVGEKSTHGKLMMSLKAEDTKSDRTPLQDKLDFLAERIAKIGLSAAILLVWCERFPCSCGLVLTLPFSCAKAR
ncbi:hypothetical protein HDU93_001087 [Gonapodya sp. JEL0774]|nr:hypothetical protein HDU93_001087 [Gonapodya sp. JEL0774]